MRLVERRLPQEFDKSFIVFRENGQVFPDAWHYHPEYELVLVTRSTGRRMVGDHIGFFEEGDLVFLGSSLPHVWINDNRSKDDPAHVAEAVVIQFAENLIGDCFWRIPEVESFKLFLKTSKRGFVIRGRKRKRISILMKRMLAMNGMQRLSSLLAIFNILADSADELEYLASPGFIDTLPANSSDRSGKITEYIMKNFDRDISVEEVASFTNIATTTFCNFFKRHYRQTFKEYLTVVRVGHACKLLTEGNQGIAQIAYASGFNNISNFNRQFKKVKKVAPSEYQKNFHS